MELNNQKITDLTEQILQGKKCFTFSCPFCKRAIVIFQKENIKCDYCFNQLLIKKDKE